MAIPQETNEVGLVVTIMLRNVSTWVYHSPNSQKPFKDTHVHNDPAVPHAILHAIWFVFPTERFKDEKLVRERCDSAITNASRCCRDYWKRSLNS